MSKTSLDQAAIDEIAARILAGGQVRAGEGIAFDLDGRTRVQCSVNAEQVAAAERIAAEWREVIDGRY